MAQVLIAADAFTGNVLTEDRYYFGSEAPYSPVLIASGGQQGPYGASWWGPFSYQGALYNLLVQASGASTGMWTSTDDGATWTELDSGNHPLTGVATPFWDGGATVIVAWRVAGAGGQAIRLQNFDLTTGTWGAAYATVGAPSTATNLGSVWQRPDGTVVVLYDIAPPTTVPPASNMKIAVFSQGSPGGTWTSTAIDLGTNMAQLPGWLLLTRINVSQCPSAMDATGRIHYTLGNGSSGLYGYQAFEPDDTLGQFTDFSSDPLGVFSGLPLGHPVILEDSDSIVIPAVNSTGFDYVTQYVGSPLSAPVFTLMPFPGIDPDSANAGELPYNVPDYFFDGSTIYAVWVKQDPTFTRFSIVRLAQTTNIIDPTLGWSVETIFDVDADSPPGFDFVGQQVQLFSVASFAAAPSSVVLPPLQGGAGVAPPNRVCCPVDADDLDQMLRERRLQNRPRWPYLHVYSPPERIPVNELDTTVLGLVGSQVAVLEYKVPSGLRFIMQGIIQSIEGVLNPGDVIWQVDMNSPLGLSSSQAQGVQGLTNLIFPLGSILRGKPWPFRRAYEFEPLTVIRSKALNVSGTPGASLVSGFLGYLIPAVKVR